MKEKRKSTLISMAQSMVDLFGIDQVRLAINSIAGCQVEAVPTEKVMTKAGKDRMDRDNKVREAYSYADESVHAFAKRYIKENPGEKLSISTIYNILLSDGVPHVKKNAQRMKRYKEIVEAMEESGLSLPKFCRKWNAEHPEEQISRNMLYYIKKKVKESVKVK